MDDCLKRLHSNVTTLTTLDLSRKKYWCRRCQGPHRRTGKQHRPKDAGAVPQQPWSARCQGSCRRPVKQHRPDGAVSGRQRYGDAGAKDIAATLANNNTLPTLNLYGNYIDDAGANDLAAALATNTTLVTLVLGIKSTVLAMPVPRIPPPPWPTTLP